MDGKVDDENQRGVNDGDWVCPDSQCANINFARRNSCNRCGKDRGECPKKKKLGQEIGKAAAEKSRGLFSADDWQCSKCGNVNWARRQQCNMCNAPKFGEIEERTGYGGGYNDRGVVEYKERRDDDDEYDEFGRRKKKRKIEKNSDDDSKDSKYSSPSRKSRDKEVERDEVEEEEQEENEEEEDEKEEEEEEEEEDGDLSKYDLSEWDDFAPAKKSTNGSTMSSEAQRSRNGDDRRDSGTSNQ
ncbi:PREDICTED: zinc finger Ran-binding domain-containing protein 2-like isoform X1 [Wasmannia auropunctata]|uniref:zinc finger Ran-binding domain-containing protein 2-like isoform X1 n=2 Tax=Wasmannia auropunctata TaxID=64793 RepID=UPI0005EDCD83|nr:PREDICTED: zinc finger Ran-binding domain-containing protein 2-like isoform X1 [Wasmannia auropunctata]XP_011707707.1 PREDICTED: zinc finger Ran-binding domain-containing protein 2-like isoform X1 [Wasmannia auropunctata]XP_011707708.1 PREDICTED: zinc finger Ran-binding domain-containing protein 2-like isoform X1 [Wasmannia auropunctata]